MTKIKVCGVTTLADALLAEKLGADYIGFIFVKSSPRYIEPARAAKIVAQLQSAKAVAVMVNEPFNEAFEIARQAGLDHLQYYGVISEKATAMTLIQAIKVEDSVNEALLANLNADYFLLDASRTGQFGGKGFSFDWSLLPAQRDKIFLAGGINVENIEEAIKQKTYAIDVNSGVESAPGVKDEEKLKAVFAKYNGLRGQAAERR